MKKQHYQESGEVYESEKSWGKMGEHDQNVYKILKELTKIKNTSMKHINNRKLWSFITKGNV